MAVRLTQAIVAEKMGVSQATVSREVSRVKEEDFKNTITREYAFYVVAARHGVDISQHLESEKLERVQRLMAPVPTPPAEVVVERKGPPTTRPKELTLDFGHIDVRVLPPKVIEDAKRMAQVYSILYAFENSLRYLVTRVLEDKYGPDWWDKRVNKKIQEEAERRMKLEKENAWHSQRRAPPIFYTDLTDLKKIIRRNVTDFRPLFAGLIDDLMWVEVKIGEIGYSRNVVAHHNPLKVRDIKRISEYYRDWQDQLNSIADHHQW